MSLRPSAQVQPVIPAMQRMLLITALLVLAAGVQLFLLTGHTDRFFAWTIDIPLTAAFLGAGYGSTAVLEYLISRERFWANARSTVPAVWLFTTLTLIATLLHLAEFRTDSFWAWAWIVVYAVVPVVLGGILILQVRTPGVDPPRSAELPAWLRLALGAQVAVMLLVGIGLFIAPERIGALWPWALTPLTGRAVGAWLIGYGTLMAHAIRENDQLRVRTPMLSYTLWAVLQLVALARYSSAPNWASPAAWVFLLMVLSVLAVGASGAALGWQRGLAHAAGDIAANRASIR